jgi:hypothetical protein
MAVVYIRWLDSNVSMGWLQASNEAIGLSVCQSVGFLVYEDDKRIDIALSNVIDCELYGEIISIPKSVILERRILRLPKQPQKDVI